MWSEETLLAMARKDECFVMYRVIGGGHPGAIFQRGGHMALQYRHIQTLLVYRALEAVVRN